MAAFSFSETVPDLPGGIESAALGVSNAAPLTSSDVNKFVALAASDNYIVASEGGDIEGELVAVSPATVNDGFGFGSVQRRFLHRVCMHQAAEGAIAVGAAVVAGAQAAVGTEQSYPVVKAGAGVVFKWRVKSLLGNAGAAGQLLLIEPITR